MLATWVKNALGSPTWAESSARSEMVRTAANGTPQSWHTCATAAPSISTANGECPAADMAWVSACTSAEALTNRSPLAIKPWWMVACKRPARGVCKAAVQARNKLALKAASGIESWPGRTGEVHTVGTAARQSMSCCKKLLATTTSPTCHAGPDATRYPGEHNTAGTERLNQLQRGDGGGHLADAGRGQHELMPIQLAQPKGSACAFRCAGHPAICAISAHLLLRRRR